MQGDANGAVAHREASSRLVDRGALDRYAAHDIALSGRQPVEMAADIGGDGIAPLSPLGRISAKSSIEISIRRPRLRKASKAYGAR